MLDRRFMTSKLRTGTVAFEREDETVDDEAGHDGSADYRIRVRGVTP